MRCRRSAAASSRTCASWSSDELRPMNRRDFLASCALLPGMAALAHAGSGGEAAPVHRYARTRLIDIHRKPIRARAIIDETNYVFQYPFAATPCFRLRLAAPV